MISAIALCNLALSRLGRDSIASLEELSEPARQCRVHYDLCRDTLLSSHDWPFALRYTALAALPSAPPPWGHAYQLPTDCLRAVAVLGSGRADRCGAEPFERGAGNILLTNVADAALSYVARISDPDRWPPSFVTAFTWRLAAELESTLVGERGRREMCFQMAAQTLAEAKATAFNERQVAPQPDAPWIAVRV